MRTPELLSDLPRWLRSQSRGSGLEDGFPWLTYGAFRRLDTILRPTDRVFEYGSGGSTLFLSSRAASVVSVEHDPEWYAQVAARLGGTANVQLFLVPPNPSPDDAGHHGHPFGHQSTDVRYASSAFCDYASTIDRFPNGFFDAVLIDGRARPSCFVHAIPKVRIGGSFILDNAERSAYADIVSTAVAAGWPASRHFGPGPYVPDFWETVIWTKSSETPNGVTSPLEE